MGEVGRDAGEARCRLVFRGGPSSPDPCWCCPPQAECAGMCEGQSRVRGSGQGGRGEAQDRRRRPLARQTQTWASKRCPVARPCVIHFWYQEPIEPQSIANSSWKLLKIGLSCRAVSCAVGRLRHGNRPARRIRLPRRQDLHPRLRHQQRVLCQPVSDVLGHRILHILENSPNWAVFLPSIVVLVQLSGHVTSLYFPSAIMGSIVNVIPGLHSPTALFLA